MARRISKKRLVEEAIWRIKMLGFGQAAIEDLQKNGEISFAMESKILVPQDGPARQGEIFEGDGGTGPAMEHGHTFPLDEVERQKVHELSLAGFLVYAALRAETSSGRITAYLYVGPNPKHWQFGRANLQKNHSLAYVYGPQPHIYGKLDSPMFSSIRYILFKTLPGGLIEWR